MRRTYFYLAIVVLVASPLAALLGAAGCATAIDVTGPWKGSCELEDSGYSFDFDFEFDISSQDDGDLEGDLEMEGFGYNYEGELEGDLDESSVEFTAEIEDQYGYTTYEFTFEGTVDGEDMTGDGELDMNYGYKYEGECEFEWD